MRIPFTLVLLLAVVTSWAKQPILNVTIQQYWHPQSGPYVELIYYSDVSTLTFTPREDGFQSAIEVTALFTEGPEIVKFDKVMMSSSIVQDTNSSISVIGISRIAVPQGKWNLQISYTDVFSNSEPQTFSDSIQINAPEKLSISSLILTELNAPEDDWIRYGVPCFPRSMGKLTYYPNSDSVLQFYTEFYQPNGTQRTMAKYGIMEAHSGRLLPDFTGYQRLDEVPFQPIAGRMDLRKLPTGTYYFKFTIIDTSGTVLVRDSIGFGRSNSRVPVPIISLNTQTDNNTFLTNVSGQEEWEFLADVLFPIAGDIERMQINALVEEGDTNKLMRFVTGFWVEHHGANAKQEFQKYMQRVAEVNELYTGGLLRGYQTDAGRVRLQYGDPTNIEQGIFDNDTYPYQIWQYNQLESPNRQTQTNRVFVFVNRQMAGNEYQLVHSNAYGEPNDPQWKFQVMRNGGTNNPDYRSSNMNQDPLGSRLNNNSIINGSSSNSLERR